jgi:hypothetical protein
MNRAKNNYESDSYGRWYKILANTAHGTMTSAIWTAIDPLRRRIAVLVFTRRSGKVGNKRLLFDVHRPKPGSPLPAKSGGQVSHSYQYQKPAVSRVRGRPGTV